MSRLLFVANLIHHLRRDSPARFRAGKIGTPLRLRALRSRGAKALRTRSEMTRPAVVPPPGCEFLGRLKHVLVDIQGGPHGYDHHASNIRCQTPVWRFGE